MVWKSQKGWLSVGMLLVSALYAFTSDAPAHLGTGLKLFDNQRYSEAAKEFELALAADPSLKDARYHLAICDFNERRYAEARDQFERLAPSGYQKAWTRYYLGRLDLIDGRLDAAIRRFRSLGTAEPLHDEFYYLGSALMKGGRPAEAIEPLRHQIAVNPRDFRAHDLLARAYVKVGRNEDANREFAEAERLHNYYREGKTQLADCHAQLDAGHRDEAWAQCGPVLQSDDIDLLVATGMLFAQGGDFDRGLQFFQRAVELDPDAPEINFDTGLTYFWKKDYDAARKFLAAALAERPDFFEALATEGAILYLQHEDAPARQVLEKAHALRPDDPAVNQLLSGLKSSH